MDIGLDSLIGRENVFLAWDVHEQQQWLILKLTIIRKIKLGMKILPNFVEESQKDERHQFFLLYNRPFTIQQDIDVLINHPEIILICDNCQRKLNHAACVLLLLALNDLRDLCFTCFLKMQNLPNKASYYVRPNLNMTLTEGHWNLLSDLQLLNGMQRYGFGNWTSVKNYLDYNGSHFSEKEIKDHYINYYLTDDLEPIFYEYPLEIERVNSLTPLEISFEESKGQPMRAAQQESICGYNPKREEHIFEYDPQAEDLVASLQFLETDTPEEVELKYQLLEEYSKRVKEREKREEFVKEHRLLSEKHNRKLLMEGKLKGEIRRGITCFSRFMNYHQFENVINYMSLQATYQGTIRQLMRHRRRLEDPTFEKAYTAMKNIKEKCCQELYTGAPQLKFYCFGEYLGKRSLTPTKLSCEQAEDKLRKADFLKEGMKITDISPC